MNKIDAVYCPICERFGRKKLLFKTHGETDGQIIIRCRGCKTDIEIDLKTKTGDRQIVTVIDKEYN